MHSTKGCEDGFNILRDQERASKSGVCATRQLWHQLRASGIEADCDRKPVVITSAARQAATALGGSKPLPKSMFHPRASDFSLGAASLDSFGAKDWSAVQASQFPMIGVCTRALLEAQGDEEVLMKMWLSLLLIPGSVVCDKATSDLWLVLRTTAFGAFLWPLQHRAGLGGLELTSAFGPGRRWIQRGQFALSDWKAIAVDVLPPCQVRANSPEVSCSKIVLRVAGEAENIATFSARKAFPGLTVPLLAKLWSVLKVESRRPSSEMGYLKVLLNHLLPDLTDDELAAIISLRRSKLVKEATSSVLLDHANLEMTRHLIEEDIVQDITKYQKERGTHPSSKPPSSSAPNPGPGVTSTAASASTGSAASSSRPQAKLHFSGYHTPEGAKALIPQVAGCWIKRDDVRHMRWAAHYPMPAGTQSHWTKTWNEHYPESKALHYCVQKVWSAHHSVTGEPIPWTFDEE